MAQILLKFAIPKTAGEDLKLSLFQQIWTILFSYPFVGAAISLVISGLLWIYVLRQADLSWVYPLTSFSYIIMLFASSYLLDERITLNKIVGIIVICIGIAILTSKGESHGTG